LGRLFGTDGIRGIAHEYPIDLATGQKLGRSLVKFCADRGLSTCFIIGRDTRESGEALEKAVSNGIISGGGDCRSAGVLPTPGIAYLTKTTNSGAGIVLSASHNPYEYNGFKVFSNRGYKLSETEEMELEGMILGDTGKFDTTDPRQPEVMEDADNKYISFLLQTSPDLENLREFKVIIDCANGATSRVAPALFKKLNIDMEVIFSEPDGKNINRKCGSQHTETLSKRVIEGNANLGLAFDGDGDRFIAVDEKGDTLTGDQIIAICAGMLSERNALTNNIVVSTVMSNMGLGVALKKLGIDHVTTGVGDRLVMEEMRKRNASLGGEDSGHIIFSDHHTTGDGILSALKLMESIIFYKKPLSEISKIMDIYPQVLINVPVNKKPDIESTPEIKGIISNVERDLGSEGRVLVRYSGTEPLCRVMVEGKSQAEIERHAQKIADVIAKELN
jgi:phosphoglucosamine mutase